MITNDIAKPYLVPGAARTATGLKGQVSAIAVGMPITRHPPHRSVRAQLR